MIKNYLKIAWRNLFRNKVVSAINIAGLSLGFAFALLTGGYTWKEMQVNNSLKNIKRQYIIQSKWKESGMGPEIATLSPLAESLKRNYPHLVANYYRWDGITAAVSKGDKHFREETQIGDSTFISMYGFKLLHGNANTALADPSSVVITLKAAIKYFGQANVVGQALSIENFAGEKQDFFISGVLEETGHNSVTGLTGADAAQVYLPLAALRFFDRTPFEDWNNSVIVSYIELQEGAAIKDVENAAKQLVAASGNAFLRSGFTASFRPLSRYYLEANNGLVKKMLYTLFFISVFILCMAMVNFINISIGSSAGRMREIGVRKVLGSVKSQLIAQFLTESVVLVLLAALFALLIYQSSRSLFGGILGSPLSSLGEFPPAFFASLFSLSVITGMLAGIFPAFVLSSLKTVDSLKGKLKTIKENILLRKLLVGFQFSIATFILIGAFVVSSQVSLFFSRQLGYDKAYTLSVVTPRNWSDEGVAHIKAMRDELAALPFVKAASVAYAIPNGKTSGSIGLKGQDEKMPGLTALIVEADGRYADAYGISLLAGSFLNDHHKAASEIVINESALRSLGWTDPAMAIGEKLSSPGSENIFTIKGVTKDFHFSSMKEGISPLCFISLNNSPRYRFMTVKLNPGNVAGHVEALRRKWAELFPGAPFEYRFMNETLAGMYRTEIQLEKAAYAATVLAIVIVMLGIIGLISASIQKRVKEIGIRKVLGASVAGIISLFIKDFFMVMLLAGTLACPLAYYVFQNWLNDYACRIDLTAQPFIISVAILLAAALSLISLQTLKAAITKPVKSLRTE